MGVSGRQAGAARLQEGISMTKRHVFITVFCAVLGLAVQPLGAEELVTRFSGTGNANTAEFEVRAPWIMEWVVSGEEGQYEVIEIGLIDASTGLYEGVALKSKTAGSGVRMFDKGGHFYFRVSASLMSWYINVKELTEQEAKEYTPVH